MTRHQIDPRLFNDSDVTRHLLAARGTQWMRGNRGDPYALLLRAQEVDAQRLFRAMRGRPELRQSESDVWVTVDHRLGSEILRDPRLTLGDPAARRRRRVFGIDSGTTLKHVLTLDDALLAMDRAEYGRLRDLVSAALGPGVEERRAEAETVFASTLDRLAGAGTFDAMTDLARPAVVAVFAAVAGLPAERTTESAALCADVAPLLDSLLCPPTLDGTRRLVASFDELRALTAKATAGRDGSEEDGAVLALLFTVGVEVAANLVCNAVLALAEHPGEWDLLCSGARSASDVVEETLRHRPPVRLESRIAARDVTLAGQEVGRGAQVVVLVEGANRDPDVFADPDRFDSGRRSGGVHLSLADGSPAGAVGPAVRLLAEAAVSALAAGGRAPVVAGEVVFRMRSPVVRGVARCPVTVG
ncbi:P450-derived glycosyltransferase activator [Streptomyces sp. NPDC127098]|uniref:cytochrome P450 family protein n=1 Tax=Streptomyces sp. NPDC127098 TaxID=3347137 RepID=UPI0036469690